MKFDKRIVTHKWGNNPTNDEFTSSNGFIISGGTYDRSISYLNKLAAEAKKDFPKLKDNDIEVFIITKSTYNKGFVGVRFSLPKNKKKRGYRQYDKIDFDHA